MSEQKGKDLTKRAVALNAWLSLLDRVPIIGPWLTSLRATEGRDSFRSREAAERASDTSRSESVVLPAGRAGMAARQGPADRVCPGG